MAHEAALDVAWLTRFGRLVPLRAEDIDPTQPTDGVWLHSTRSRHVIGRGVTGLIDVSVRINDEKRLAGTEHALILWNDHTNIASIQDISTNGTYVLDQRLAEGEQKELKHNALIWFGPPRKEKSAAFLYESFGAINVWAKNYSLDMTLGSGAFGDVYQVRLRTQPNRVFAVKVAHYVSDKRFYGRSQADVMQEVEALERVQDHPNVCAIEGYYVCKDRKAIFTLMPRLSTDLKTHFAHRRPTVSETQTILKQLMSALFHIQFHLTVHRDVKNENIFVFLGSPLILQLGDFGLSYRINMPSTGAPASAYRAGTAWYMPPEVVSPLPLMDPFKFDNFSCGVAVSHLLMGDEAAAPTDEDEAPTDEDEAPTGPWNLSYDPAAEKEYFTRRELRWDLLQPANLPIQCLDVLYGLTNPDPILRWSVQRALKWPWIMSAYDASGQALPGVAPTIPYIELTDEDGQGGNSSAGTSSVPHPPSSSLSSPVAPPPSSLSSSSAHSLASPPLPSPLPSPATPRRSPRLLKDNKDTGRHDTKGKKTDAKGKKKAPALSKAEKKAKDAKGQKELRGRRKERAKV
ncbi:kinase-like protein [Peniophora sp. CONT]|nr:kinase-like protein [Peniophora sp. CONT]